MRFENNIKIEIYESFSKNTERQERYLSLLKKRAEPYTPKEENFTDLYSEKEINTDLERVVFLEKKFEEGSTKESKTLKRISDVFEGVVVEQAEQGAWFGEKVHFYPTSRYDDFVNGVDGVAEFYDEQEDENGEIISVPSHTALSFDVVFSREAKRIEEKLQRTKEMIERGELTEVKYFEDEEGNRKSLRAPRIVLGSRLSSAEKLIDLWGSKTPDKNKKLAQHPMQIKLLLESYLQLYHFSEYARELGKPEIAHAYGSLCNRVSEILNNEKKDLLHEHYNEISDDIVFETVRDFCSKASL